MQRINGSDKQERDVIIVLFLKAGKMVIPLALLN